MISEQDLMLEWKEEKEGRWWRSIKGGEGGGDLSQGGQAERICQKIYRIEDKDGGSELLQTC